MAPTDSAPPVHPIAVDIAARGHELDEIRRDVRNQRGIRA